MKEKKFFAFRLEELPFSVIVFEKVTPFSRQPPISRYRNIRLRSKVQGK